METPSSGGLEDADTGSVDQKHKKYFLIRATCFQDTGKKYTVRMYEAISAKIHQTPLMNETITCLFSGDEWINTKIIDILINIE